MGHTRKSKQVGSKTKSKTSKPQQGTKAKKHADKKYHKNPTSTANTAFEICDEGGEFVGSLITEVVDRMDQQGVDQHDGPDTSMSMDSHYSGEERLLSLNIKKELYCPETDQEREMLAKLGEEFAAMQSGIVIKSEPVDTGYERNSRSIKQRGVKFKAAKESGRKPANTDQDYTDARGMKSPRILSKSQVFQDEALKIDQIKICPKIAEKYAQCFQKIPVVEVKAIQDVKEDRATTKPDETTKSSDRKCKKAHKKKQKMQYTSAAVESGGLNLKIKIKQEPVDTPENPDQQTLPDAMQQVKQEPLNVMDYEQLTFEDYLPTSPNARTRSGRNVRRINWHEVFDDDLDDDLVIPQDPEELEDLPKKRGRKRKHKISEAKEPEPKKPKEPKVRVKKQKIKSYMNRRRIDWNLASELLKLAEDKDFDLFYRKAGEMEERCRLAALEQEEKERYELLNPSVKTEPFKTEPVDTDEMLPTPPQLDTIDTIAHMSPAEVVKAEIYDSDDCDTFLQLLAHRDAKERKRRARKKRRHSVLNETDWYDLWRAPEFSKEMSEFKSQCVVPHMCKYCTINDHDYCKPAEKAQSHHDVTPCIHFYTCKHMTIPSREPSIFESDAEAAKIKYAFGVVNNKEIQHVENDPMADDMDIDILGDEADSDTSLPEPELHCNESLTASPKKAPEAFPGTELLSAQLHSRERQIRTSLGVSETTSIDHLFVACQVDSHAGDNPRRHADRLIHWYTHACEIIVPRMDVFYRPPVHLDMFTDIDKVDPFTRQELEKPEVREFYNEVGTMTQVTGSPEDIIIKIRLQWLDAVRLLVQQVAYNKSDDTECCKKQNIISIPNRNLIDRKAFQEYLGDESDESFSLISDYITENHRKILTHSKVTEYPSLEMTFPFLPITNHKSREASFSRKNRRKHPIMRKDSSYIDSWPKNVDLIRDNVGIASVSPKDDDSQKDGIEGGSDSTEVSHDGNVESDDISRPRRSRTKTSDQYFKGTVKTVRELLEMAKMSSSGDTATTQVSFRVPQPQDHVFSTAKPTTILVPRTVFTMGPPGSKDPAVLDMSRVLTSKPGLNMLALRMGFPKSGNLQLNPEIVPCFTADKGSAARSMVSTASKMQSGVSGAKVAPSSQLFIRIPVHQKTMKGSVQNPIASSSQVKQSQSSGVGGPPFGSHTIKYFPTTTCTSTSTTTTSPGRVAMSILRNALSTAATSANTTVVSSSVGPSQQPVVGGVATKPGSAKATILRTTTAHIPRIPVSQPAHSPSALSSLSNPMKNRNVQVIKVRPIGPKLDSGNTKAWSFWSGRSKMNVNKVDVTVSNESPSPISVESDSSEQSVKEITYPAAKITNTATETADTSVEIIDTAIMKILTPQLPEAVSTTISTS